LGGRNFLKPGLSAGLFGQAGRAPGEARPPAARRGAAADAATSLRAGSQIAPWSVASTVAVPIAHTEATMTMPGRHGHRDVRRGPGPGPTYQRPETPSRRSLRATARGTGTSLRLITRSQPRTRKVTRRSAGETEIHKWRYYCVMVPGFPGRPTGRKPTVAGCNGPVARC
jgi:hypothetical protein